MDTRNRSALALAIAWLAAMGAMAWWLFNVPATDDYVGWLPLIVVAQIPTYLAVVAASAGRPLPRPSAVAVAIPAAIMVALAAFFVGGLAGRRIWPETFLDFRPFFLGVGVGLCVLGLGVWFFMGALARLDHPQPTRRILGAVILAACAAALTMIADAPMAAREPGMWIVVSAPMVWTLPMWPAALRPRPA